MNFLNKDILEKNIDSAARYDFVNNKVFGSSYFVYQKGNIAFEKCYGIRSLKDSLPIDSCTLFRLASMTKPITAFAALILVDRKIISLDDSVDKYLPDFKDVRITDRDYNDLGKPENIPTIRNILSHTSGIGSSGGKIQDMSLEEKKTIDGTINYLIRTGLDYEPGTKQAYSGVGAFDVLVKIIELVCGIDFQSFLQKEIFIPCNMCDTTFEPTKEQYTRMVAMHNRVDDKNAEFEMQQGCTFGDYPCTHYLGGAGLVSTLRDYCNFAKMLLNKGRTADGKTLISEETYTQLFKPQISEDIMPGNERWGLGVRVITDDNYLYLPVGSFGWSGAFGSHFWIDPVNEIFAVFMKNSLVDGGSGNESAVNFEKAVYSSLL